MGKKAAAPPAVDYSGAADKQYQANIDAARTTGRMNNPNIVGPLGGQTVTWNGDQPTITQNLTDAAQKTLDAQQRVDLGLANLGEQGLGTAQKIMGTPFNYTGQGIQSQIGDPGKIAQSPDLFGYGTASGGPSAGQYGTAQGGVQGPNLQTGLDTSGLAKMPVNAGTTGPQAIMARLQPQLDRQRAARQTELANQGLTAGGEAYNTAMQEQGQNENDLMSQAALQGLNLDMAARQQGLGEQQALGSFGNQSQLSQFGANMQNQQAGNQAIAQNFAQGQAAAQAGNQGIAQNQSAALQQAQFQNAGQNQNYNQLLQQAQFGNTASDQDFARQLQQYNMPLNQILGLMSGSQIQMPQFQGYQGSNVAAAPVFQGVQAGAQDAMQRYNAEQSANNALTSGLFSLGGAALGGATGGMFGAGGMFGGK